MDKLLKIFNDNPSGLRVNEIENTIDKLMNAINKINPQDPNYDFENIKRTSTLYYGLLKIINLFKNQKRMNT